MSDIRMRLRLPKNQSCAVDKFFIDFDSNSCLKKVTRDNEVQKIGSDFSPKFMTPFNSYFLLYIPTKSGLDTNLETT